MIDKKKDRRITVRVAESDYKYLAAVAYMAGMKVSSYIRMIARASISAAKVQERKGAFKIEDIETILDNKL